MSRSARATLPLFDGVSLKSSRIHEAFGISARSFAAMAAGLGEGPVLWVRSLRDRRMLNPHGLAPFIDPARILVADCERPLDILWSMEEALRLGAAPIVIAELDRPPDLTVSRRLQLAAEAGKALGLCLVSDAPVTNAAESRWFCAPAPAPGKDAPEEKDSTHWRLSLIKNKTGTLGAWEIAWDASARRIIMVSKIAGGPDVAQRSIGPRSSFRGHRGGKERAAACGA